MGNPSQTYPGIFSTSWPSRISLRVRVSHSLCSESAAWMPQRDRRKRPYQDWKKQPHQGRRKCLMWILKPADTKQALTFKRLRSGLLLTQLWAGTGEEQGLLCLNMETMSLNFYLFIQRKSRNQLCWWEHLVGGLQQGRERLPSGFQVPSSDIQSSWVGGNWRSVNIFQKDLPDITRLLHQTQKWIMRYSGAKDSPKYCGSGPAAFQLSTVIKF